MANFQSIAAAGQSLERFLTRFFADHPPVPGRPTRAVLIRTEDLDVNNRGDKIGAPALSVFLYRVDFNKTTRAAWSSVASHNQRIHLPLDLHFLLTPWAANALDEQRILGCAMQCLEETPILSGPLLAQFGDWATHEAIQVLLEDLPTEDVMRTFDSLPIDYKISVPYVVRVVRIDGPVQPRHREATSVESRLKPMANPAESFS